MVKKHTVKSALKSFFTGKTVTEETGVKLIGAPVPISPVSSAGALGITKFRKGTLKAVGKVGKGIGKGIVGAGKFTAKRIITKITDKPVKSAIGSLGALTGAGVLFVSPTAREFVKERLNPAKAFETGKNIGEFIESTAEEKKEKVGEPLKDLIEDFGPAAGAAAAGAGLVIGGTKIIEKIREIRTGNQGVLSSSPVAATPFVLAQPPTFEQPKPTTKPRRRVTRRRRRTKPMRITQNVKVLVNHRVTQKTLNKRCMLS